MLKDLSFIVCSNPACQAIDNVATGSNYWFIEDKSKVLCSKCNPKIGKWHGLWKKQKYNPKKWKKLDNSDFIEKI